jgi:hypothetical protein
MVTATPGVVDIDALVRDSRYLVPRPWPKSEECLVPPDVLMVCGYRRTGKDTFAKCLQAGVFEPYVWCVNSASVDVHNATENIRSYVGAEIISFASALRACVFEALHIPPDYDYEKNKDVPVAEYGGKTLRDFLIRVASLGRAIDPAHWMKSALLPHFSKPGSQPKKLICSDFRYVNEHADACRNGIFVTTVRLFRSEIPVPPDIPSEHELDNFCVRYVLTRNLSEYEILRGAIPAEKNLAIGRVLCGQLL